MSHHAADHDPVELEGVPAEEGVDEADAADRLDLDPEEQPNRENPEERARQTRGGPDPVDD